MPRPSKIDDIFFPTSFLSAIEDGLGEEFSRLSNGKRKGYVVSFWENQNITKVNRHNRSKDADVFPFGREIIERNFGDRLEFSSINNNGYYLKPSNTRHGYAFSRSKREGYKHYKPTSWLVSENGEAFQSWESRNIKGSKRGYKLSAKVEGIVSNWNSIERPKDNDQCGFENTNRVRPEDYPQAITRSLGRQLNDTNVNVMVMVNREALKDHKQAVEVVIEYMYSEGLDTLEKGSRKMEEARGMVEGEGLERGKGKEKGEGLYSLGEGKTINSHLNNTLCLFDKSIEMDGLVSRTREIDRILSSENSTYPITYTEASTGRYTSNNAVLQGYHRSVRYAALDGCYEYDMEAAHQNILLQKLKKEGKEFEELDVIREYVTNKKQIRIDLAAELETTITIIKGVLNALTYGARLTTDKRKSIYDACNSDKELTRRVVDHLWFKKFSKVSKKTYEALIGNNMSVTNVLGITRDIQPKEEDRQRTNKQKKNDDQKMNKPAAIAHILQGHERQILDAIIKRSNRKDIALLVHDCVVFYNQQSPEELSRIVKEETGFDIEFSEDKY